MKFSDFLRAPKHDLSWGDWSDNKVKKADFPMSKRRGGVFPLTRKYRWCTIKFKALEREFIVMVAYHKEVPEFLTVLAEKVGYDTRTLARFEYHGNHPQVGWHAHAVCGDLTELEVGITKPLGQKRIPAVHNRHRRDDYTWGDESMSDNLAVKTAAIRFGLPYIEDMLGDQIR